MLVRRILLLTPDSLAIPPPDVQVLRVVKSKKETSLGISVEGYTVDSGVSENGDVDAQTGPRGRLTRHFVQAVNPDGLFGRLNCLFPDDEILQVNGFRIHGRSHKEAVRCLRCLPAHIELVIARSVGGESALTGSIAEAYAAQTEGDRDDTVVIAASEVGSVATGVSSSPAALRRAYAGDFSLDESRVTATAGDDAQAESRDATSSVAADGGVEDVRSSIGSNLPNAQSPNLKVNEWMHRSQVDFSNLSSEDNLRTSGSPPLSALHTEEPSTSSQRNFDTTGAPDRTSVPYFTADRVTALLKLPTPSPRVVDPSDCADPSSMRWKPTWSSVPLVIILRRNTDGFGFSFTEFREREVAEMETGVDNATLRRTATLGRHSTFTGGISANNSNSSSSTNYQTRSATLPLKGRSSSETRSPRSLTLRRRRNEKGHVLLIDRINPQGCVGLDGRLSVGDRLLFVNDRKVANCSLNEAATVLQHAPTGYTMVGVAKMKMVCVPITQTLSAPLFGSAGLSLSRSMGGIDQQSMSPSLSNTGQSTSGTFLSPRLVSEKVSCTTTNSPSLTALCTSSCSSCTSGSDSSTCSSTSSNSSTSTDGAGDIVHNLVKSSSSDRPPTSAALDTIDDAFPDGTCVTAGAAIADSLQPSSPVERSRSGCFDTAIPHWSSTMQYPCVRSFSFHQPSDLEQRFYPLTRSLCDYQTRESKNRRYHLWGSCGTIDGFSASSPALFSPSWDYFTAVVLGFVDECISEALVRVNLQSSSLWPPTSSVSELAWTNSPTSSCCPSTSSLPQTPQLASELVQQAIQQVLELELQVHSLVDEVLTVAFKKLLLSECTLADVIPCLNLPTPEAVTVIPAYSYAEAADTRCAIAIGCFVAPSATEAEAQQLPRLAMPRSFTISLSLGSLTSTSSQQSLCSQSSEDWLASLDYLRDTDDDSAALRSWSQEEFVKEYKNDHPLDYYSHFVVSPDSEYLHAPNVSAPPMPQEEELIVRIKANSFPLGIKLDALAAGGIDGCRVVQVLRGGAVEHSASLAPGDYITRINSDSLRQVTNVEAFRIVRRASVDCPTVEIAYFPSSKVAEHRANYVVATDLLTNGKETAVSLANCSTSVGSLIGSLQDEVVSTNTVDLLLTTEPLPFPSDVLDAEPWQQTREIKLLKLPGESGWGLKLTGPELWDSSFSLQSLPLPPGISRPCFVSEVIAKSPADRCGLIEPGDIIVGINGLDASCAGCRGVAEWIYSANLVTATTAVATTTTTTSSSSTFPPSDGEFLSSASSLSNAVALDNESVILYLLTLPLNSLPVETLNRLTAPLLLNDITPQSSDHKSDAKCIPSVVLPSPVLSPTVLLDNHENHNEASEPASVGFAQPSNYAIQPALLSSDESSFMEEPSSVTTLDVHQDLSVPQPLAFAGLSISAPQAASQSTSETERESSPATERPLPSPPPPASRNPLPAPPATSSGIMSSYTDGGSDSDVLPAVQSLESQSAWRNIGSQLSDSWAALPEKYRRPTLSDDEIHIVSLVIRPTSPSPTPNRSSRVDCDTLGIRLVGHKDVNNRGVFICGIREGSLAAATGGLLVSDEIVQVNNICVLGLTHLSAQLLISKEAESVRRLFSVGEDNSQANTLSIVVRRNPTYNYSVMAKPSNLASHFSSCPPGPTKTPSSAVESEIKESTSSVFHSSPLRPAHEVSRPPPTKKSVNVEFVDVVIERNQSGFGLCLVNMNNAHEIGVFVQSVDPNSPAGQAGKIANWDRIIAVNGQLIDEYDTALQLLTRCPNRVSLRVSRIKPAHSLQPIVEGQSTAPLPKVFSPLNAPPKPVVPGVETTIELLKGTGDLGFSIVGGTDTVHGSVFVHEVYEGGLVARDGRLKPGDRLLAVNSIDLRKATHATARNAIRSTGEVARLTVLRQAGAASPDQDYLQTYSVRLEKSPDQTYGLVLIDTTPYQGTTVGDILRGSPALRSSLIQPGDVILEVNDRDVHCLSSDEVVAVLKQFPTSVVLKLGRPKLAQARPDARLRLFTVLLTRSPTRTSAPNLAETFSANVPNAFGVILREATEADWAVAPGNLIIADILPNSPAYRSGMLQVGDRLLGIDREPVDWLQIEELYAFVASFESLTFEFGRLPPVVLAPADLFPAHSDPAADFHLLPALPPCENSLAPLVEYVPSSAPEQPAFPPTPQTAALPLQVEEAREEEEEEEYEDNDVLGTRVQVRQLHLPFVETPPDVADGWLHDAASAAHRPRLGLSVVSAHGACGPKVSAVAPDSPAEAAGLRVGDRLLGLDDHLLVALGGQNVEKVLAVVEERWLSRPPRDERGQPNSQVMLTVITTAPQPPPRATRRASTEMLNGLHAEDFGALPGGFYPPDSSHRILRAPPGMHMGPRAPPRRWPKDVGDNLDVNLQAAPPGLISAFGQTPIAVGAWETDAGSARPEPFHLPGDRDPGTVSESYYYPPEEADVRYDDHHYAERDEPDSANDHEPPALENDLRDNTSDQHAFT
ncbi:hypothetical protein SprV_0802539200 [Sparganum proliferum]